MATKQEKGKCDACGKSPRVLTEIESGQRVCRTCLRELRPPRPEHLAREKDITYLRQQGFNVGDDLTKNEADRLFDLNFVRTYGKQVSFGTAAEELDRLARVVRLQERGIKISDNARLAEIEVYEQIKHFFTKVVGVNHKNDDGSSRQAIIKCCRLLEPLVFDHEEHNPQDPNAIGVCRQNGQQIGYLRRELAEEVVSKSAKGYKYAAHIMTLTGGEPSAPSRGVNIVIVVGKPGTTNEQAQSYVNRVVQPQLEEEYGTARQESGCLGSLVVAVVTVAVIAWTAGSIGAAWGPCQ